MCAILMNQTNGGSNSFEESEKKTESFKLLPETKNYNE